MTKLTLGWARCVLPNSTIAIKNALITVATSAIRPRLRLAKWEVLNITDDDDAPTVSLTVNNDNIAEAGGAAVFTATLSAVSSLPVTVDLGFTGTATLTDDYTRSGTQITIPAGQSTGTITVTAVQDDISEGNETVIVGISGATNATATDPQSATTTITDDEGAVSVTLSPPSVNSSTPMR